MNETGMCVKGGKVLKYFWIGGKKEKNRFEAISGKLGWAKDRTRYDRAGWRDYVRV
jgi:hypothetical protein